MKMGGKFGDGFGTVGRKETGMTKRLSAWYVTEWGAGPRTDGKVSCTAEGQHACAGQSLWFEDH